MGNGGWGEASSLRHFPASQSHDGDAGWSPNRGSSGKSPQAVPEGPEGTEEATLRGLDDMASCKERVTGARRLLGGRAGEHSRVWAGGFEPGY